MANIGAVAIEPQAVVADMVVVETDQATFKQTWMVRG